MPGRFLFEVTNKVSLYIGIFIILLIKNCITRYKGNKKYIFVIIEIVTKVTKITRLLKNILPKPTKTVFIKLLIIEILK